MSRPRVAHAPAFLARNLPPVRALPRPTRRRRRRRRLCAPSVVSPPGYDETRGVSAFSREWGKTRSSRDITSMVLCLLTLQQTPHMPTDVGSQRSALETRSAPWNRRGTPRKSRTRDSVIHTASLFLERERERERETAIGRRRISAQARQGTCTWRSHAVSRGPVETGGQSQRTRVLPTLSLDAAAANSSPARPTFREQRDSDGVQARAASATAVQAPGPPGTTAPSRLAATFTLKSCCLPTDPEQSRCKPFWPAAQTVR